MDGGYAAEVSRGGTPCSADGSPWSRRTHRDTLRWLYTRLKPTTVYLKRADIALDYAVPTRSLLLYSRYLGNVNKFTSKNGGLTWAYNRREGPRYIRVYNKAAQQDSAGPLTRVEVEWKPKPIRPLAAFLRRPLQLSDLEVGSLLTPDLDHFEAASLLYERELRALRYATKSLPPLLQKALVSGRQKMARSGALVDPSVFLTDARSATLLDELRALVPSGTGPNSGSVLPGSASFMNGLSAA